MINLLTFNVWYLVIWLKATSSYTLDEINAIGFLEHYHSVILSLYVKNRYLNYLFEEKEEMCTRRFSMNFSTFERNIGTFRNLYKFFYNTIHNIAFLELLRLFVKSS